MKALPKYSAETFTYCGLTEKTMSTLSREIGSKVKRRGTMLTDRMIHRNNPKIASAPFI